MQIYNLYYIIQVFVYMLNVPTGVSLRTTGYLRLHGLPLPLQVLRLSENREVPVSAFDDCTDGYGLPHPHRYYGEIRRGLSSIEGEIPMYLWKSKDSSAPHCGHFHTLQFAEVGAALNFAYIRVYHVNGWFIVFRYIRAWDLSRAVCAGVVLMWFTRFAAAEWEKLKKKKERKLLSLRLAIRGLYLLCHVRL